MKVKPIDVGVRLSMEALRGVADPRDSRPWVLALSSSWRPQTAGDDLPTLRSALRGLGAVLVVVTSTGAWRLAPDDAFDTLAVDEAQIRAQFGFDATHDVVLIVDEDDVVRSLHVTEAEGLAPQLVDAISAASEALHAPPPFTVTRREWILSCLGASFAMIFLGGCRRSEHPVPLTPPARIPGEVDVVLHVNGIARRLRIEPRVTLLDALRERIGLTGTKKGCDHGQCGACTVIVDGRTVNACLTLAVMAQDKAITTVEGLAHGDALHPVQAAFVARDLRTGRVMTRDLADYHVPVNADVPAIEVIAVPETDAFVNEIGAKGVGEIGITGCAAAIANAVFHATGRRIRDLPITLDKLL